MPPCLKKLLELLGSETRCGHLRDIFEQLLHNLVIYTIYKIAYDDVICLLSLSYYLIMDLFSIVGEVRGAAIDMVLDLSVDFVA